MIPNDREADVATLAGWIAAAKADAEAAQRQFAMQEGINQPAVADWRSGWLGWGEFDAAPHIAGHIANMSPDVAIAMLAVVQSAVQIDAIFESEHACPDPDCDACRRFRTQRAALDALRELVAR